MRIRMLQTVRGAADGFTVIDYRTGTEHDLGGHARALDLARVFLREGWAVEVPPVASPERVNELNRIAGHPELKYEPQAPSSPPADDEPPPAAAEDAAPAEVSKRRGRR